MNVNPFWNIILRGTYNDKLWYNKKSSIAPLLRPKIFCPLDLIVCLPSYFPTGISSEYTIKMTKEDISIMSCLSLGWFHLLLFLMTQVQRRINSNSFKTFKWWWSGPIFHSIGQQYSLKKTQQIKGAKLDGIRRYNIDSEPDKKKCILGILILRFQVMKH